MLLSNSDFSRCSLLVGSLPISPKEYVLAFLASLNFSKAGLLSA